MVIDKHQRVDGSVLMVLAGDFDLASAAEVRRVGLELLSTGCARLLVDLMDVPFMDSTGLGTLIALKLSAEQAGIPFLLWTRRIGSSGCSRSRP